MLEQCKNWINHHKRWATALMLVVPFLIWMWTFSFFLSGQGGLIADAISYFDHIGFFTDHLAKGEYPLWNPFWYEGAPYHFFLRRIGEFNPAYLLIAFGKMFHLSHVQAYMLFLLSYFALGAFGFYLLLQILVKDRVIVFWGYLLFLFSSWGTQLFYNYIILLFVPLIWFFYFFLSFMQQFRRYQMVGILFTLGIILTTYIPFYFLTVFSVVFILGLIFYPLRIWPMIKQVLMWMGQNRFLVILGAIFLLLSLYPGYQLYQESKAGEFVMPARGVGSEDGSAVAVGLKKVASGDFINNSSFDRYLNSIDRIQLGDFYIPYVFVLLCVLALLAKLNRLIVLLFLAIVFLMLIIITQSTPLHEWLYHHIYFFKFIRNIYYFFWLAVLPMMIIWVCLCWRSWIDEYPRLLQWWQEKITLRWAVMVLGIMLIIPHSVIVYHGLTKNMAVTATPVTYYQNTYKNHFYVKTDEWFLRDVSVDNAIKKLQQSSLYYASRWYADIQLNVPMKVLIPYVNNTLYLYDRVALLPPNETSWGILTDALAQGVGVAWVADEKALKTGHVGIVDPMPMADKITENDSRVKWLSVGPNSIVFTLNNDRERFLVITQNYHSKWHVQIDGKTQPYYRSNYAFGGFWLPAGEHHVVLQFDSNATYLWHWGMLILYTIVFIILIILGIKRL